MKKLPRLAIRVRTLSLLEKIPMNAFELSQRIGCELDDLQEQLLYLEKEGKIERLHSEKFNEDFWKIKK
jgi:predicted Rossmann fold nucleotide-binding protein DprA/Smf involved in DNA uptake